MEHDLPRFQVRNFQGKKNQFTITDEMLQMEYFKSYNTIVFAVKLGEGKLLIDSDYWQFNQTKTTNRNLYAWLKELISYSMNINAELGFPNTENIDKKWINKAIAEGQITMTRFNK